LRHSQPLESEELRALERFTDTFVTCTRCVTVAGEEAVKIAEETNWHGHSKSCKKGGARLCRWKFPRFPLARTIFVDANRDDTEEWKMDAKVRDEILDRVMKVLVEEKGGQTVLSSRVKRIMESTRYPNVVKINLQHGQPSEEEEGASSEEEGEEGTHNPEQISENNTETQHSQNNTETQHSQNNTETQHSQNNTETQHSHPRTNTENLPKKSNKQPEKKPKRKPNTVTYVKRESPEEYKKNIRKRIEEVLKKAAAGGEPITYQMYETAVVQQPRKGSEVLLRRDIDEIFINNYNPEWITDWNANIDISPVYDYFGTITYITDYFTKDSTGLTDVLKTAVKQLSDDKDMRQKCYEMANHFMTHRQVGESEAIYKLFANMKMVYSSVSTIFVPTEPKGERRQFLQRQDPESGVGFKVDDKEGLFLEKPDLISKYERRKLLLTEDEKELFGEGEDAETLDQMTLCQFVKMYEGRGWHQLKNTNEEGEVEQQPDDDDDDKPEEGELAEEDDFNFLIVGHSGAERRKLPQQLTLENLMAGEPKILNKRTFPRALRFFKKKFDRNPHLFYLAELMLFHPFRDENELFPENPEKCEQLYLKHMDELKYRKAQLMPFLESVEEAQLRYEEMKADEEQNVEDKVGPDLDPEHEQDIADLDDLEEEHPDYYHIDPNQLDDHTDGEVGPRRVFKKITLPNRDAQLEEARQLDRMQKEVLAIGVNYAKRLVTFSRASPNHKISKPSPPLVIVHGGAGSGKSKVIYSLYNQMTHILQKEGDDPSCPYVVLTSFTGAASANINGQTLHSLFGFKFGSSFLSMSERQRAVKRLLFRDLKCVIIDEISMVSADLFYNLDLRLREITMRDIPFGGVSIMVFGDLFQLQPPKARYVFEQPTNQEHALAYSLRNLWRLFKVVNLVENHRQGEDKIYGDLLNRIRIGAHTEEDVSLLEKRIRPRDDPILNNGLHIYGTNAKVNARNTSKLEEIDGELFTIKAKNASRTVKTFKTNNAGCIKNTPFLAVLKLKIGAEVILVHNVDTLDGLTNGCRGVLVAVEKNGEAVKRLVVKFNNPNHGRLQREKNPCRKHPDATYIDPIHWQYFLGGATASVLQFPVKGAAAMSSHKIQGQTVGNPNALIVDVTSVHQPGMAYVMFSRVQSIEQLYIVDKIDTEKITVNDKVIKEAKRMHRISMNQNPCEWMNPETPGLKVCSFNTCSLRKHMEDIRTDPVLMQSDILFVQETWLEEEEEEEERYQLDGYQAHFTSPGRGKGIATYIKKGLRSIMDISKFGEPNFQLAKVNMKTMDVIAVYRSRDEPLSQLTQHLRQFIDPEKDTLVMGDVNICATKTNDLGNYLQQEGFRQLVSLPTHIGGGVIDQAHHRPSANQTKVSVTTCSHYFSDHDSVTCIVTGQ